MGESTEISGRLRWRRCEANTVELCQGAQPEAGAGASYLLKRAGRQGLSRRHRLPDLPGFR